MPNIIRLLLSSSAFENTYDDTYFSSVMSRCAEWGPRGKNIQSSPLVTWSSQWSDLKYALDDRGIRYEILDVTDEYKFMATAAPKEYDYEGFGTIHLCTLPTDDARRVERLVAIPIERLDYQIGRYGSGMYTARSVEITKLR